MEERVHNRFCRPSDDHGLHSLDGPALSLKNVSMKQCVECSAQYDDSVSFCAKDGRSLLGVSVAPSRLCPHCANSIAEDAAQCPYCKADVEPAPEWLIRDERPNKMKSAPRESSRMPKIVLFAGIILCVIAAGLLATGILGRNESGDTRQLLDEKIKALQVTEERVKAVEAELAKARDEAAANVKEAVALKAQLEESQKELAVKEQRLGVVNREVERLSGRRTQVEPRIDPRPAERVPPQPRAVRRPAEPGVYETVRATAVHEQPVESSRVITRIGRGTRIHVVRSSGDWLEVVSKRGNPPGFIPWDDTMFVSASN
jgi:hypothetical protein